MSQNSVNAPPMVTDAAPTKPGSGAALRGARRRRDRRRRGVLLALVMSVLVLFAVTLCLGRTVYSPSEVLRVISGQQVAGASFAVGELRLPRALTALLAGGAFGISGVTFQTMLRNALASPDVIGITSGASAAAVAGIVVLGLGGSATSALAVGAGLLTALIIYLLAYREGVSGARLVLIGIGVGAMLDSVVASLLLRANAWDIQESLRWLTGSLSTASWSQLPPLAVAVVAVAPIMLMLGRRLQMLQLGDDTAAALGVDVHRTRLFLVLGAVALAAFATATTGPIAFVAFLAGPIAVRLVGPGGSLVIPAALVGAALVLAADLLGQFAFDTRFPVGVITGAVGAPYLLYLLIRSNRIGGAL